MATHAQTRRQFVKGACLGTAAALLAACGATATTAPAQQAQPTAAEPATAAAEVAAPTAASAEPVTIEVWWWVDPAQEAAVQVFEETNPDIKVELVDIGETVYGTPKYTTAVAAGEGPDIAVQNRHTFQQFAARNLYMPIDDLFDRDGFERDQFPANQMETLTWNGALYGLADTVGMRFFFWNRQHFEEAGLDPDTGPQTWDDLIAYAEKLIVRNGDEIQRYAFIPGFPPGLSDQLLIYAMENGGVTKDPEGRKSMIGEPEWIEALQWCTDFTDDWCGGFEMASGTMQGFSGQAQDMFASGAISMSSYGDWMMGDYAAFPDLQYDGFPTMPTAPALKGTNINWACGYSFTLTQKEGSSTEGAWAFLKYAISAARYEAEATVGMELSAAQWEREGLPGTPIYYVEPPAYAPARDWVTAEIYEKYPERLARMAARNADAAVWANECGILGGLAASELWTEMATAWEAALSHTLTAEEAMAAAAANHQKALDESWAQIEGES